MSPSKEASKDTSLAPSAPKVYLHSSPRETLLPHLLPLLPYTVPIVRRIQFHLQTSYAQILSTLPPSAPSTNHPTTQNPSLSTVETAIPPLSTSYAEPPGRVPSEAISNDRSLRPPSENTSQSANPSLSTAETSIPPLNTTYAEPPGKPQSNATSPFPPLAPRPAKHFAAAYIDRSRCPETEVWSFSTLELPPTSSPLEPADSGTWQQIPAILTHHLSTLTPQVRDDILAVSGVSASHNLTRILCGAIHRSTLEILQSGPIRNDGGMHSLASANARESADGKVVRGHTPANTKFLVPPDRLGQGDTELPDGLEWAGSGQGQELGEEDIKLALSLTEIPRRVQTMMLLPRLGIRTTARTSDPGGNRNGDPEPGALVAWAFLGPDASLTTLHVQPSHRRQGLAQKLTRKLFAQVGEFPNPMLNATAGTKLKLQRKAYEGIGEGEEWNHADVLWDNEASAGAMKAVGARVGWDDYWAVVDLEVVKGLGQERESGE